MHLLCMWMCSPMYVQRTGTLFAGAEPIRLLKVDRDSGIDFRCSVEQEKTFASWTRQRKFPGRYLYLRRYKYIPHIQEQCSAGRGKGAEARSFRISS